MSDQRLSSSLIVDALADNAAAITLKVDALLHEQASQQAVVPCESLDVQRFAQLGFCELQAESTPRPGLHRYWGGEDADQLFTRYEQVVWRVSWNGYQFQVLHLNWETGCGSHSRNWIIADKLELAEAFLLEVQRKTHAPGNAILVFSNGRWNRSESLYAATQSATFDDLVLADDLKSTIRDDFASFLKSEERYQRMGIAWRRGALLIGPPGNGKTHCVRALVKELEIASLYVQSLSHHFFTPEQLWQQVFERARGLRPCVLVLEDLDSLVTAKNRSFFLNQLDGFERNHGLIVLATTNHPERIDAAIIERPSRFDRKYHFHLPTLAERETFLMNWQEHLVDETGWTREQVEAAAESSEGFSFAYLKELVISSVMKWMQDASQPFASVVVEQAALLAGQMKTAGDSPKLKRRRRRERLAE